MRKYFVLYYGGVLLDKDVFNGERGEFGKEYSSYCISNTGVESDERENRKKRGILMKLDLEILQ